MDNFSDFEQTQNIVGDFVSKTLASINGEMSRLMHVAILRDLATGRYRHAGLEAIYSEAAVDQALRFCHQELFERILGLPLQEQEIELRRCLEGFESPAPDTAFRWREYEFYRCLAPSEIPEYLRDLFCSNLNVLLSLIAEESVPKPAA